MVVGSGKGRFLQKGEIMETREIAHEIMLGIINTGVEGGYDSVSCSTAGDYPSIGVSQWEGSRADDLLEKIPGGDHFVDRPFSDIERCGEVDDLRALLDSGAGRTAQQNQLENDCMLYVDALQHVPELDDSRCIIYAGIWCPTSHIVVEQFMKHRQERGYNIRSLSEVRDLFRDQYASAACIPLNCYDGYANRAENTYQYVAAIDLTTPYGVPEYGQGPFGR